VILGGRFRRLKYEEEWDRPYNERPFVMKNDVNELFVAAFRFAVYSVCLF
jgi:hypothetical protein